MAQATAPLLDSTEIRKIKGRQVRQPRYQAQKRQVKPKPKLRERSQARELQTLRLPKNPETDNETPEPKRGKTTIAGRFHETGSGVGEQAMSHETVRRALEVAARAPNAAQSSFHSDIGINPYIVVLETGGPSAPVAPVGSTPFHETSLSSLAHRPGPGTKRMSPSISRLWSSLATQVSTKPPDCASAVPARVTGKTMAPSKAAVDRIGLVTIASIPW